MNDVKSLMQRVRISKPHRATLTRRSTDSILPSRPVVPWLVTSGESATLDQTISTSLSFSGGTASRTASRNDSLSLEGDGALNIASIMEKVRHANENQTGKSSTQQAVRIPPNEFATSRGMCVQGFLNILKEEQQDLIFDGQSQVDFNIILQSFVKSLGPNASELLYD